jgi:hypothetical protein
LTEQIALDDGAAHRREQHELFLRFYALAYNLEVNAARKMDDRLGNRPMVRTRRNIADQRPIQFQTIGNSDNRARLE